MHRPPPPRAAVRADGQCVPGGTAQRGAAGVGELRGVGRGFGDTVTILRRNALCISPPIFFIIWWIFIISFGTDPSFFAVFGGMQTSLSPSHAFFLLWGEQKPFLERRIYRTVAFNQSLIWRASIRIQAGFRDDLLWVGVHMCCKKFCPNINFKKFCRHPPVRF